MIEPSGRSDGTPGGVAVLEGAPPEGGAARPLRFWRQAAVVAVFFVAYTTVRDLDGNKPVSVDVARDNALGVVAVERWLHVFAERQVQAAFLHDRLLVSLLDDYYGTAHFAVAAIVLVVLFRRFPDRYLLWRNVLAATTALALVGFFLFPLMPPRLMPPSFGFVDTLRVVGGVWNFGSAPVNDVSNQYAAMPSLHTAWAGWCAAAVWPLVRHRWAKALAAAYPVLTVFCVVVTANHFFADALAGFVTLAIGYAAARLLTGRLAALRPRKERGA